MSLFDAALDMVTKAIPGLNVLENLPVVGGLIDQAKDWISGFVNNAGQSAINEVFKDIPLARDIASMAWNEVV